MSMHELLRFVVMGGCVALFASAAGARQGATATSGGSHSPTGVAPRWSTDFAKPGTNLAYALEVFDDGRGPALYIGGLGGGPASAVGITRYDGRAGWETLGSGLGGVPTKEAYALESFANKLYVGGWFTTAGTATCIAAWNGTAWETLGTGMSGPSGPPGVVYALTTFDDGTGAKLYAGGYFTQSGGVTTNRIARWNGTSWSALGSGMDASVRALCAFNGELYAGGDFTTAGGASASYIAKWNGSTWAAVGGGVDGKVLALGVFDNKLYAGGEFATAGGVIVNHIAAWNGASWSALGNGTGTANVGGPTRVKSLATFNAGFGAALYVGGDFTTVNGMNANRIAKWNGSQWFAVGSGATATVNALATFDFGTGGELWAGGTFYEMNGETVFSVAGYDGVAWHPTEPNDGITGELLSFETWNDGNGNALYAGGSFDRAGTTPARYIAGYRDGEWFPLGSGVDDDDEDGEVFVYALEGFDDGSGSSLYAGGSFVSMGGVAANGLAKWNGTQWSAIPGIGCLGYALEVFDDGNGPALYVGGVVSVSGSSAAGIAKWNGAQWSALDIGVFGGSFPRVYALATHDDGTGPALYVGGRFTSAGASNLLVNHIAKWNGTQWSALGSGMGGVTAPYVRALASATERIDEVVHPLSSPSGPMLFAGGQFTASGGVTTNRLARWNGTSWSSLDGSMSSGYVPALHVHRSRDAGGLYAGGSFSKAGAVSSNNIARWGAP